MAANGALLVLRRYSDTPFNTAEFVWPHWRELPRHPPTALAFVAAVVRATADPAGRSTAASAANR